MSEDREPIDVDWRAMKDDAAGLAGQQSLFDPRDVPAVARPAKPKPKRIELRKEARPAAPTTATMLAFPARRRHDLVRNIARGMAKLSRKKGEEHLQRQLQIQADTMRRRGIAEAVITRELRGLATAARAAVWRCVLVPDNTSPPEIA